MRATASVSRETPPTPEVARHIFSDALPTAERYADILATDGVTRGLIGPREAPRLWDRHLLNCAMLGEAIPKGQDVCDIGTGAGLPGMVLALSRRDLSVTLVEPLLRRTVFLEEVVAALGMTNVEVVRARAEELHGSRSFSVVTSRAVAPLTRLLDWCMPLVSSGGALVAMKGSSVSREIESARGALRMHRAGTVTVTAYGSNLIDPPTTVLRVETEGRGG
ncbi:MAG: 16S rRNA (guanine(527)-N(7))-methyltransferase RsmG [Actinomycetota bacterium]|nr:16S rRNA (guanine(527)-N(7))-methyltransferase RsmG [Actinomycetota bacterium]